MAFVQRNQVNVGTDPATIAYDSNVTAGSALICGIRISDNAVTIDGVSDNVNGAWTLIAGPFTDAATQQRVAVYGFINAGAGATTVSVNTSAAETTRILCAEYSGRDTAGVFEDTANSGFTAATTTVNSGNATATAGADLFGFLSINSGSTTFAPSGGFVERTETDGDRIGAADLENQTAGDYAFTGDLSSGEVHISIIVSLKAAAAGGGILRQMMMNH